MAGWPKFWNTADTARLKKQSWTFWLTRDTFNIFLTGFELPNCWPGAVFGWSGEKLGLEVLHPLGCKASVTGPKKTIWDFKLILSGCQTLWQIRWNLKEFMPVQKLRRIQGLSLYGLPSAEWLSILKQWFEQPHLCQHKGQRAKLRFGPWFHYLWLPSQKTAAT